MTCCIAAIADVGTIFGAADRMLTSGDIEFEPKGSESNNYNQKVFPVTASIAVMTAGDMGLQSEIIRQHVIPAVQKRLKTEPEIQIPVQDVVDMYVSGYNAIRRNRAQTDILAPLGLNYKSFADQSKFSASFLDGITKRLLGYSLPTSVETIVVGVEPHPIEGQTVSRLFTIHENTPTCCDAIRFAAIGSGARHAESHMMQAGHGPRADIPETILSVYVAKKRSEIAPGVGKATNMIMFNGSLNSFDWVKPDVLKELQRIYETLDKSEDDALGKATKSSTNLMKKLIKKASAGQQSSPETGSGPTSS